MKRSLWILVSSSSLLIVIIVLMIFLRLVPFSLKFVVSEVSVLITFAGIVIGVKELLQKYKKDHEIDAYVEEVKKRVISTYFTIIPDISKIKKTKIIIAQVEDQIVKDLLSLVVRDRKTNYINSLILIYFCKKYEDKHDPDLTDLTFIKGYSNLLKIGEGGDDLKIVCNLYTMIFTKESFSDLREFQKTFINRYLTEQGFYFITETLNQSKNFVSTLRKIIKEGKLNAYGVKQESIAQIENELRTTTSLRRIFLVIGQHIAKKTSIREFLESLPKLGGILRLGKIPFSTHLVKISDTGRSSDLLVEVKKHYKNDEETMLWIIPIDTTNIEEFVFPADRSFRNEHIRESYEIFNNFMKVTDITDSNVVWSLIKRSKVTISQLLTVIPFNIFCPGITQSESDFIITNYDIIKAKLDVNSLSDFGKEKPDTIAKTLLEIGVPQYIKDETDSLGINFPIKKEEVYQRYVKLSEDIVDNSRDYAKAVEGLE